MRNHVHKDYKWSSYNAYTYGKADEITDNHPIYKSLSGSEPERMKKGRYFVRGMIRDYKAMKGR